MNKVYTEAYLSKESLLELIQTGFPNQPAVRDKLNFMLNKCDSITVKHAEWTTVKTRKSGLDYCFECSNCHKRTPDRAYPVSPDFCPSCNAIMDGHEYSTEETDQNTKDEPK